MPRDPSSPEATWLFTLSFGLRLAIVRALATGEKTIKEVAEACKAGKSGYMSVAEHLKKLKAAGIVSATRDGLIVYYKLNGARVTKEHIELTHEQGIRVIIPLGK
jgi:DNA-binding transcriptional ArsR family regulator